MDKEYMEKLIETEQRSKSNTKRLDDHDKKIEDIHGLVVSVKELALEVKLMREDMNKIDKRVLAIEDKPNKRMEQIIGYILSTLIGGIIGFFLWKMGIK